jgi:BlaI family penicillinase repressor
MQQRTISESERAVMEVLWARSPLGLAEIVAGVQKTKPWSAKTIQTFVNRLKQKGAVVVEKGEPFTYAPAYTMEEARVSEVQRVVSKLYGGSVKQFVTSYLESAQLSGEDIEELSAYLRELKDRR